MLTHHQICDQLVIHYNMYIYIFTYIYIYIYLLVYIYAYRCVWKCGTPNMSMLTRNTMINHGIWGWGSSIISDPPNHCLACQQTHCQACKAHKAQRSWKMMCCSPRASCSLANSCNVWVEKVGHFSGMLSSKSSEKCAGLNGGKMGLHMD